MSNRNTKSAGSSQSYSQGVSPYRPQTTNSNIIDKSSIIWKDFINGVKKRKASVIRLQEAALENTSSQSMLKRLLLDVRQNTLRLIEDALEIEYRSQLCQTDRQSKVKLPPISSFRNLNDKEDIYALCEIITDVDDLFKIPNIRVMLPHIFPNTRNPFMLGKSVDELAYMIPPHPEPGNLEVELKVLELLRYKRASKALIRAETQVLNRLPITLYEVERLLVKMNDDLNLEKLVRCVCTLLDNDTYVSVNPLLESHSDLKCLLNPVFNVEAHELLNRLNNYKGLQVVRVDIQASIRQVLRECVFDYLDDPVSAFLLEWINIVLGRQHARPRATGDNASSSGSSINNERNRPHTSGQQYLGPSLGTMLETVGENDRPGSSSALTTKNVIDHNYNDLTSVVSMSDQRGTHENIHVEAPALIKMRSHLTIAKPVQSTSTSTRPQPSGSKTTSDRKGTKTTTAVVPTDDTAVAKASVLGNRRIRNEVERVIRELGLVNDSAKDDEERDHGNLSALRFELYKMQQELLRRHVLDPRHYNPDDAINAQIESGSTHNSHNYSKPTDVKAGVGSDSIKLVPLANKTITLADGGQQAVLNIVLDTASESLIGNMSIMSESSTQQDAISVHSHHKSVASGFAGHVISASMVVSKLIFNRLTQYTVEELTAATKNDQRMRMLQNIFDQMEQRVQQRPKPQGRVLTLANRVLFNSVFTESGVLVDMVILRNDECTGLVIQCTPLSGLFNTSNRHSKTNTTGTVSITVQDKELAVLLINQFGLFLLSRVKWSSMEMVAQWLSSRVKIRKVHTDVVVEQEDTEFGDEVSFDNKSVNSQVSFDEDGFTNNNSPRALEGEAPFTAREGITSPTMTPYSKTTVRLMMLDIKLDRRVDISNSVLLQWKSRNVPSITGMNITVRAEQDLEMLVLVVRITFPTGSSKRRSKLTNGGNETSNSYEHDDDEDAQDAENAVEMTYRITESELAAFGATELLEVKQQHKRISLSMNTRNADESHPEAFIWNVFSRLVVIFKGSNAKPFAQTCSAYDPDNWSLSFNRKLAREIKTVSQRVLVLTVSVVGSGLLFESEPVDANSEKIEIGPKNMSELELVELVHSEGLQLSLLEYSKRKELAMQCLNKLKIVEIDGRLRIESYTYPETQMLKVALRGGPGRSIHDKDDELGSIEISYHYTLSDLRVLIKHELDYDDLPKQFRFLYKGASCSVKQEPFRRAWECLPRCIIVPKLVETNEISIETDDILHRRMKEQGDKSAVHMPKLVRGQRRVAGRFAVVPVATLCFVQENSNTIYLLHDSKDLLSPGDILRIGNVNSRDYIVAASSRSEMNSYPKTVRIEPEYDLLEEPDFNTPTTKNFAYPRVNAGVISYSVLFDGPTNLLRTVRSFGVEYEFTDKESEALSVMSMGDDETSVAESRISKNIKGRKIRIVNQSFSDCWLWKCIPMKDDRRPKWRQMYDDGLVQYSYEYSNSVLFERHFRINVPHSYLEVLCTDSRCPALTLHRQRVLEMALISLETYTRLAFDRITDWMPQYKKGIERTKFIKLIKDVEAFPDLKRPARVAQIDMLFQKEVKSENGIVQKYITYAGFCRLLQDLSLIRFPPKRKIRSNLTDAQVSSNPADNADTAGDTKNDDDSSVGVGEMDDLVSLSDSIAGSDHSTAQQKGSHKSKVADTKRATTRNKAKKQQMEEMEKKMADMALAPAIDPIHVQFAFQKFVLDYIMTYPEWYDAIWKDAKLAAMRKEAIPYCAATRIAAKHRGGHDRSRYRFFLRNLIVFQANIRRKLSAKKTNAFLALLFEDWCFRHRYNLATRVQSLVRMFLKRCWYFKIMLKVKEQQVLVQKARRFRLKKLRQAARHGVIYKEAKRVNGVMVFIRLVRKDARNYTKDFGVTLEVYAPSSQSRFQFVLEEAELRTYMMMELGVDAISAGDMLDKRNLQRMVSSRLIIHKPASRFATQQVLFSKHALGQRGEKAITKAKRIGNEFFVAKIFETGEDIAVQMYHRYTSKVFTCAMTKSEMREWITDEYKIVCTNDVEREKLPSVLKPENKLAYYNWILDHLAIDTRKGVFKVLFSCHLLKSQKMQMIVKIQAAMRRAMVRPKIVRILDEFMLKVKVSAKDSTVYYVNRRTGASSWDKPRLLGQLDLTVEPTRKWVQLTYENNGIQSIHYVNPYTGMYTHLVPDQAARMIQAVMRNFLLRPIRMTLEQFVKAGIIFKSAATAYEANSSRLAAVINYAMVSHTITLDEPLAKKLYAEAVELSEANPLVTRAYAFFMLGTCEAPMSLNRERAHILLGDARRKDEDHSKFQTAFYLFKFACIRHPKDYRTLVNLALVLCVLYDQNHVAEKLLRRALALAPFEERVVEIWKYLKDRFPERQLLYNPQSRVTRIRTTKGDASKRRTIHGRPVAEDPSWAGWCFVEDDKYNVSKTFKGVPYWYNPADGTESADPPDLPVQWAIRRNRSQFINEVNGLDQYFDPITAEYFQHHALTDTYS